MKSARSVTMSTDAAKKKQHTTRELVLGGGIFLLSLPFVAFALIMSLLAIVIAVLLVTGASNAYNTGTDMTQGYLFMLGVYGIATAFLLYFSWRVMQRSVFLMQRIRGLRQEKQRAASLVERDTSRLEMTNTNAADVPLAAADDEHQAHQ
jgi:hypothetical protein